MKNKTVAGLLALFGGAIGLHKFYTNDPGAGIFYIIITMFTAGFFLPVGALLGLLDAVRFFTMSDQAFDGKYNKGRGRGRQSARGRNVPQRSQRNPRQTQIQEERARYNNKTITSKQRNNPFRKSADRKFAEYDLEGALEDYAKATELTPADMDMHFNMACIYSLKEDLDKSLHHLEEAMKMGFKNVEKINNIDQLAYLRIQPEFDAFVANGYKQRQRSSRNVTPQKDLLQEDALLAQLNKLKEMRDRGLLSEKEFTYEKERLTRRR